MSSIGDEGAEGDGGDVVVLCGGGGGGGGGCICGLGFMDKMKSGWKSKTFIPPSQRCSCALLP